MKITVMLTDSAMQFNLTPESDHEKAIIDTLGQFTGPAQVHRGVSVAESRGGYLRDYGSDSKTVAITIRKPGP